MTNPPALGASLYVPATHPKLGAVLQGPLRSIIVCTEDALAEADLQQGLHALAQVLPNLPCGDVQRFVRVRNPALLQAVLALPHVDRLTGFVLPKITANNFGDYEALLLNTTFALMPTLETREVFDDSAMQALRQRLLNSPLKDRILALRIGGNDLMALLGLRRPKHTTLYQTPMGLVIARLVCCFRPYGFGLTAPVFETLDNPQLLAEELEQDLAQGLIGKTAIHPDQVPAIDRCYRVQPEDMRVAERLLSPDCPAVFKMANRMCELATHKTWAEQVVQRAKVFGVG